MKCPKNYSIPTNNWLKPLEILHQDNNLIMSSELTNDIKKENVIVKITKSDPKNFNTQKIYNIIKKSKHIIEIYCFLSCNENKTNLTNEYKDILGFCTRDTINNENIFINLEIMKKYKHSLLKYQNKLNLETVKQILLYLLNMQYELYYNYGFVHRDIHLGNIFIEKNDPHIIEFISYDFDLPFDIIQEIQVKMNINFKLYLTDFEDSLIFKKSLYPEITKFLQDKNNIIKDNTLMKTLYNTFETCLELIKDDTERYNLFRKYQDFGKDSYVEMVKKSANGQDFTKNNITYDIKTYHIKILSTFARCLSNEQTYNEKSLSRAKIECNELFNYLFEL